MKKTLWLKILYPLTIILIVQIFFLISIQFVSISKVETTEIKQYDVNVEEIDFVKSSNNLEGADMYLHPFRFDVIVKTVYAYFTVFIAETPSWITFAYIEHLRIWNNFSEYCKDTDSRWDDYKQQCTQKNTKEDFISSFYDVIKSLKQFGFQSNQSHIPVDKNGFLLNGAHRLSASIVLSEPVAIQHLDYETVFKWDFLYFRELGFSTELTDKIMLEYMKIQHALKLTSQVSVLALFSQAIDKNANMRVILRDLCSRDGYILYEKNITITKPGMRQLLYHIYERNSLIELKALDRYFLFSNSDVIPIRFFFFFGKNEKSLKKCRNNLRYLYNEQEIKSACHIPDTPDENLLISEMILNKNVLQF